MRESAGSCRQLKVRGSGSFQIQAINRRGNTRRYPIEGTVEVALIDGLPGALSGLRDLRLSLDLLQVEPRSLVALNLQHFLGQ